MSVSGRLNRRSMTGNLRSGLFGILLTAAAVALGIGWVAQRLDGDKREVRSSIVAPEKPVVMRTKGGLLEVATVRALKSHGGGPDVTPGKPLHLSDVQFPEGVTPLLNAKENPVLVVATVRGGGEAEEPAAEGAAKAAPAAKAPAAKAPAAKAPAKK
jgi:hypothetical protein